MTRTIQKKIHFVTRDICIQRNTKNTEHVHVYTWNTLDTSMYIDTHYVLSLIIVNANSSEFSAVFIFSFLFSIFFFLSFFFFQLFMLEKMLKKDFKFSDFYSIVISRRFDSIVDLPPPIISSLFRSSVPLSFCTKKKKKTTSNITLTVQKIGEKKSISVSISNDMWTFSNM